MLLSRLQWLRVVNDMFVCRLGVEVEDNLFATRIVTGFFENRVNLVCQRACWEVAVTKNGQVQF